MSLLGLCNATIAVERPTVTADSFGGTVRSFSAVYSGLAASIQPANVIYTPDNAPGDRIGLGMDGGRE